MKRCGSVGTYGLEWMILLTSSCEMLWDSVNRARRLISSCERMLKPALCGGVKNGLNVFIANGPSKLTRQPLVMFVAIPV